jgi:hypothetical protein
VRAWPALVVGALVLGAIVASVVAGCTALVSFNDMPVPCDGGSCLDAARPDVQHDASIDQHFADGANPPDSGDAPGDVPEGDGNPCSAQPDGGTCSMGDACHNPSVCVAGVCVVEQKKDGTTCGLPLDGCHSTPLCTDGVCGASTALPDGAQWLAGNDNARCCGGAEVMTTSVDNCGVCGVKCKSSQTCENINDGHYFCTPCSVDPDCWSNCCSFTIKDHCSPSNCSTGICAVPNVCPDGAHCQADTVNYCSY